MPQSEEVSTDIQLREAKRLIEQLSTQLANRDKLLDDLAHDYADGGKMAGKYLRERHMAAVTSRIVAERKAQRDNLEAHAKELKP
jgi:hypothetical protein